VPVLLQHQGAIPVVHGEHDDRTWMLEHQPAELLLGFAGHRHGVDPHGERCPARPDLLGPGNRPALVPVAKL
jgi:hypothetical protein